MKFLLAFLHLAIFSSQVTGFRITCSPWKRERIDPIASPGGESAHMHTFWGGRNLDANTRNADDLRSGCTSCANQFDKSAYWMPTLYYVKKNATVPVEVAIFHVYYSGGPGRDPLPDDFAILAGDPDLTEEEYVAQGGGIVNWNYESSDEVKEAWQLPKKRGDGWLRANIGFPVQVIKDDDMGRYRECDPSTETCLNIPRIFFAVWYDARDAEFFTFDDGEYFMLSSGGGHAYHGDIINGWEPHVAKEVAETYAEWTIIGGEIAEEVSDECAALMEEAPYMGDLDIEAINQWKAGNASVQTGPYDLHLTITDGKSVSSTWDGVWGEHGVGSAGPGDMGSISEGNSTSQVPPSTNATSAAASSPSTDVLSSTSSSPTVVSAGSSLSTTISSAIAASANSSSSAMTSSSIAASASVTSDNASSTAASKPAIRGPGCPANR